MHKRISLALLIGGLVALIHGINASDSIASGFSRLFAGAPTDQTLWLLVGAIVAAIGAGQDRTELEPVNGSLPGAK
jgi:hypothetical protein